MVDTMKELQSMLVRLKTPIAIIPKSANARSPVRNAKCTHERPMAAEKQTEGLPSVWQFTIAG